MKSINHNIRSWLIVAGICIAVIILISIVFRGCHPVNSHQQEKKAVQQISQMANRAWDSAAVLLQLSKRREDSLLKVTQTQADQLAANRRELVRSRQQIRETVASLDQAKALGDTAKFMVAADSLRNKIVSQDSVIERQETITDSTILNYEYRLKEKDRTIQLQADLLHKMRTANLEIENRYNTLHADYGQLTRKLKSERTLGRVLAGAVLIVGGLFIAK